VRQAKQEIRDFLENELHLELSEEKTLITHVNDGFNFLGFHIQRVQARRTLGGASSTNRQGKERVKGKIKDLTSRSWTWMDEYNRMTTLNAIVKGWAEYYKHTSLLEDIEEITRFTWFRYLGWLLKKHKGSRKHNSSRPRRKLSITGHAGRQRYVKGQTTLEAYQWLPTRKELKRSKYMQKGRNGISPPLSPG
jgi:RNA-directed DNA polymerase